MWNLKYDTNETNRITDIENRLVVAKGEGVGGRKGSKVLLWRTENYTQYPMINHNGNFF